MRIILLGTLAMIALVCAMLVFITWNTDSAERNGEIFMRLLGVFGILDVLGTIVLPIAIKIVVMPSDAAPASTSV